MLLVVGAAAASQAGRRQEALDFALAAVELTRARGATPAEVAHAQTIVCDALRALGLTDQAEELIEASREALEEAHDNYALSRMLAGLADIRYEQGNSSAAIKISGDALRCAYWAGDISDIARAHHWLGLYLAGNHAWRQAMTHLLAAGLIRTITNLDDVDDTLLMGRALLANAPAAVVMPRNLTELASRASELPGVELEQLVMKLAGDQPSAETELNRLIADIRASAAQPSDGAGGLYRGIPSSLASSPRLGVRQTPRLCSMRYSGCTWITRSGPLSPVYSDGSVTENANWISPTSTRPKPPL